MMYPPRLTLPAQAGRKDWLTRRSGFREERRNLARLSAAGEAERSGNRAETPAHKENYADI